MKTRSSAKPAVSSLEITSSWGAIRIAAAGGEVTECVLAPLKAEPSKPFCWMKARHSVRADADRAVLKKAEQFVKAVFAGKAGKAPPFRWPAATPFTLRVWHALEAIPSGSTLEYGALARRIGRPGGSRAVGRACGANPLPLFIPCHRVLPKDGTLGGFSSGLPWKRLLLDRERAVCNGR